MEVYFFYVFYVFLAVWLISLAYNLIYFIAIKSDKFDGVFFNRSRSFPEALDDLHYLEKGLGKQFNSARNKILFYRKNVEITRRKYSYYAEKIENGFIKLYLGSFLTKKEVFDKLDRPVRWHFSLVFIFVGSIIGSLFIYSGWVAMTEFSFITIMASIFLIAVSIYFFVNIVSINMLFFYLIVNFFLYLLRIDCSKLYKNIGIMEFLTKNWSAFNSDGAVIGAAAVGSFHSYSGDGFGGFGGGSFGGGGAGGNW